MVEIVSLESGSDVTGRALEVLNAGGLVVLPTDTVYGVAASVDRPEAVARLYWAKGRPSDRPIPVLVSSIERANSLTVGNLSAITRALMQRFWPGPLTIVVPAVPWLPREIVGDTGQVGLRMPDHPGTCELIERAGGALATTSANRSDHPETVDAASAARELGERVDLVIDGGTTPGGVASTVVRVDGGEISVLRRGAIPEDVIRGAVAGYGRHRGQR